MKVFIALVPDPETSMKVNKLRARYYPASLRLHPPHLTLVAPFEIDDLEGLERELAALKLLPPELTILGLGIFPGRRSILHLKVGRTAELSRFQTVVRELAGQPMPHPFNPHLTIGRLAGDELKKAQSELSAESWNWRFKVSGLVIFRKEDDHWVEAVTFQPDNMSAPRR